MNIKDSLNKLYSLHQFGIKLGLDNIKNLLEYIGNPQSKLKAFHIAGSNGKGSTSAFIASILQEAGYKTGLYTSPHFIDFNERIKINGEMIGNEYIVEFMNQLDSYIDKYEPTFFELTTAMAFKYFADNSIDYAVIETGLGGRLDATNTISPLASVITSISLEHTNILGESVEKIAFEKSGIIKNGSKTFISIMENTVEKVFSEVCSNKNSALIRLSENVQFTEDHCDVRLGNDVLHLYNLPLKGKHQFKNASLAITTVHNVLAFSIEILLKGILSVVKNTGIEGRYEIYCEKPRIIFDSAHNMEGIESFLNEFEFEHGKYSHRTLIYGTMKDKNIEAIVKKLGKYFDSILVTSIDYERAATTDELIEIFDKNGIKAEKIDDPAKFILDFHNQQETDCLAVLGSIYILGEIKTKLKNKMT